MDQPTGAGFASLLDSRPRAPAFHFTSPHLLPTSTGIVAICVRKLFYVSPRSTIVCICHCQYRPRSLCSAAQHGKEEHSTAMTAITCQFRSGYPIGIDLSSYASCPWDVIALDSGGDTVVGAKLR